MEQDGDDRVAACLRFAGLLPAEDGEEGETGRHGGEGPGGLSRFMSLDQWEEHQQGEGAGDPEQIQVGRDRVVQLGQALPARRAG